VVARSPRSGGPNQEAPVDVLVVGAGVAGLVCALALARRGVRCRLVDRRPEARRGTRCPTIWSRTLETFDLMGLPLESLLGNGIPLRAKTFHVGGDVGTVTLEDSTRPYPYPLVVGQDVTERMLTAHLTDLGVRVERGCRVRLAAQEPDGVTALLHTNRGATGVRASWVVLATGQPTTDADLGIDVGWLSRDVPDLRWARADVRVPDLGMPGELIFRGADSHGGLVPLPDGRYRLFVTLAAGTGQPSPVEVAAAARQATGLDVHVADARSIWCLRPRGRLAERRRVGRCVVVGDAAAAFPMPVYGLNNAVHDALDLGWKLASVARGEAGDELLDTHAEERGAAARAILDRAVRVVGHASTTGLDVLRDRLRRDIFDVRGEPPGGYPPGPLVWPSTGVDPGFVGDRLPHRSLTAADGGRTTPHELIRGCDGWTLLLTRDASSPVDATTVAALGRLATRYRAPVKAFELDLDGERVPAVSGPALSGPAIGAGVSVIRPDGHVGLHAAAGACHGHGGFVDAVTEARRYLDTVLFRSPERRQDNVVTVAARVVRDSAVQ